MALPVVSCLPSSLLLRGLVLSGPCYLAGSLRSLISSLCTELLYNFLTVFHGKTYLHEHHLRGGSPCPTYPSYTCIRKASSNIYLSEKIQQNEKTILMCPWSCVLQPFVQGVSTLGRVTEHHRVPHSAHQLSSTCFSVLQIS